MSLRKLSALDALPSPLCLDHDPIVGELDTLLYSGRDAIEAAVLGREERRVDREASPELMRLGASFVTLRMLDGALRGCIGELEARRALVESVRRCAVSAALRDPRFPPVSAPELEGLRLGISVLTPSRRARADEVEVGRHGLLIERGAQRGVLLPEVATENGWDAETFLSFTCRKAGLPVDAWREPATAINVFETLKLAED